MLYQKAAGKAVQIGLHCRPSSSASSNEDSDATGRSVTSSSSSGDPPRPIATVNLGHLGVIGAIWAMNGRKSLVPSNGLAMQVGTERRIFDASHLSEGLVKELDGPSLWYVPGPKEGSNSGPKEGSNSHEGREVLDVGVESTKYLDSGHNWHFRHIHPRFRFLKGAVKRVEQEGLFLCR